MQGSPPVTVVRLAHRPGRDERMTTHVGLTARALGADRVVLPAAAGDAIATVEDVTDRFGGPFTVEPVENPVAAFRERVADAVGIHLTMYGERVQDVLPAVRTAHADGSGIVLAVGAGKVPFEVYERTDYNVAVTNQPHSEVAALAVVLDRLFDGGELDREWVDAAKRVVPDPEGKRVEPAEDSL